jgi:putative acetyltransferase
MTPPAGNAEEIRAYEPDDCDAVLHVWAAASAVAHPFLSDTFLSQERRAIREVHLPNADTWVWIANGRIAGFISLLDAEIGAVFVDPAFHRSGTGTALVNHARQLRGALEVEVFWDNLIGRAFYAKLGFEPVGHNVHAATGLPVLRLRLAPAV